MEQANGSSTRKETLVDTVKTKKRRTAVEKSIAARNEESSTPAGTITTKSKKQKAATSVEYDRPPPVIATETEVIYEVEKIVGMFGTEPDSLLFRVRWKGYAEEDDTFEPLSNLDGCLKLVREYLVSQRSRSNRGKGRAKRASERALLDQLVKKIDRLLLEQEASSSSLLSDPINTITTTTTTPADSAATHTPPTSTSSSPPPSPSLRSQRAISISSTDSSVSNATLSSFSTMSRRSSLHTTQPLSSPAHHANGNHSNAPAEESSNSNAINDTSSLAPLEGLLQEVESEVESESESEPDEDPDKRFERQLAKFRRIFSSQSWPPITVETPPREAIFQTKFKFIDRPRLHKDLRDFEHATSEFMLRCQCGPGGCRIEADGSTACECLKEAMGVGHGIAPFDEQGKISKRLKSTAVWVCNRLCSCGPECVAKASSLGRRVKLKIKWTGVKGWGVFLDQDEPIPPRTFISRYVGEIITTDEAERRGYEYDRQGTTYLFDMDCNNDNEAVYTIDAQRMGNESHFFNHSCRPNMQVYNLFGDYADVNMMTPSFWTIRTIRKGDELTFDYNGHYKASWLRSSNEKSTDSEAEEEEDAEDIRRASFRANGHPSSQQQPNKRRRRVDSEDDDHEPDQHHNNDKLFFRGGPSTTNVNVALPSKDKKRAPVDRSRAARKRSSGARFPLPTGSCDEPPAARLATSNCSSTPGRRVSSGDFGTTLRIRCYCGTKKCRKYVHLPRLGD